MANKINREFVLQIIVEDIKNYSPEPKETVKEHIMQQVENDPDFLRWLFNEMGNEEWDEPTPEQMEDYEDFLNSLD